MRQASIRVWKFAVLPWLNLVHRIGMAIGYDTGLLEVWLSGKTNWIIWGKKTPIPKGTP